jgi:hypothetical protein
VIVRLYSIEIPVGENPIGVPTVEETIEGDDARDIVEHMASLAGTPDIAEYIHETKRFLANVHAIHIPTAMTGNKRELCETFLRELRKHGLIDILES